MTNGDILRKTYKGQKLRVLKKNDQRWLLGFDVANIADYINGTSAYHAVDQENRTHAYCETSNGRYEYVFANEEGLQQMASNTYKEEVESLYLWCLENVFTQDSLEEEEDFSDDLFGTPETDTPDMPVKQESSAPSDGLEMIAKEFREQEVRLTEIDGSVHMVASDVADVLGYNQTGEFTRLVSDDYRGLSKCQTPGGIQEMVVVNELGLYEGLASSNQPAAKPFQDWLWNHLREYRKDNVSTAQSTAPVQEIEVRQDKMEKILQEQLRQSRKQQEALNEIRNLLDQATQQDTTKALPPSSDGAPASNGETTYPTYEGENKRQWFNKLVRVCSKNRGWSKMAVYHQVYTDILKKTGVDIYQIHINSDHNRKLDVVEEEGLMNVAIKSVKLGIERSREQA